MKFPQYLWRIAIYGRPIMLRRGNDHQEPIEKSLAKDPIARGYVIGVMDYCDVEDARRYSSSHNWDWLNS